MDSKLFHNIITLYYNCLSLQLESFNFIQMLMSVLKTLITATATLIVPTQRVPTLVLVNQVGLEMGHRAQVHVCLLW